MKRCTHDAQVAADIESVAGPLRCAHEQRVIRERKTRGGWSVARRRRSQKDLAIVYRVTHDRRAASVIPHLPATGFATAPTAGPCANSDTQSLVEPVEIAAGGSVMLTVS